jgi:hypothetical protein
VAGDSYLTFLTGREVEAHLGTAAPVVDFAASQTAYGEARANLTWLSITAVDGPPVDKLPHSVPNSARNYLTPTRLRRYIWKQS